MHPPAPPLPTDAELQLLRHLWANGPSTVRAIHDALNDGTTRYTTTLRLVQNLFAKKLVFKDSGERQHVYAAAADESATMAAITRRVMDRAFGGSAAELAMRALDARPVSRNELRELRGLIARIEKGELEAPRGSDGRHGNPSRGAGRGKTARGGKRPS